MREKLFIFGLTIALVLQAPTFAAPKDPLFEGTVLASETRGGVATQLLYTRARDEMRIEKADKSLPEPINIINLTVKTLTIVYPHNSTFVQVDLTKAEEKPGAPNSPPGFPSRPSMPVPTTAGNPLPGTGFSPPPRFPAPPPMPSRPPLPNGAGMPVLPAMPSLPNNPAATGAPMMPMMPMMPPMRGFGSPVELKKTEQTRDILGYDCTLYTVSDPMGTMEIWAMPTATLFPFRLLQLSHNNRHFGRRSLEEEWVGLLQKESLFPLEVTLRTESKGSERFSFKVDKIEKKKIENPGELFSPPKNYYEITH